MSEKRREPRIPADLTVEVWARNAAGEPFFQSALVRDISSTGALLTGIEHKLRCGDVMEIGFTDKTARFRVVWTLDPGGLPRKIHAAVHLLGGHKCPWSEELKRRSSLAIVQNQLSRRG